MNKDNYVGLVIVIAFIVIYILAITTSGNAANESVITEMSMWAAWVQAGAAIITLCIMVWLGIRQNKLAEQQKELAERQNELVQKQVNLDLYERRFRLFDNLRVLLNSVAETEMPRDPRNLQNINGIYNKIIKLLEVYRKNKNKIGSVFLLTDELNQWMESVVGEIGEYLTILRGENIGVNQMDDATFYGKHFSRWNNDVMDKKNVLVHRAEEAAEKFKECLDFRNI